MSETSTNLYILRAIRSVRNRAFWTERGCGDAFAYLGGGVRRELSRFRIPGGAIARSCRSIGIPGSCPPRAWKPGARLLGSHCTPRPRVFLEHPGFLSHALCHRMRSPSIELEAAESSRFYFEFAIALLAAGLAAETSSRSAAGGRWRQPLPSCLACTHQGSRPDRNCVERRASSGFARPAGPGSGRSRGRFSRARYASARTVAHGSSPPCPSSTWIHPRTARL